MPKLYFASPRDLPVTEPLPGVRSRVVPAQDLAIVVHDLDAGTILETHRHDEERVGVVIKGSVLMVIAGEQRILAAGDTYRIPATAAHGARVLEAAVQVIEMWVAAPSGTESQQ